MSFLAVCLGAALIGSASGVWTAKLLFKFLNTRYVVDETPRDRRGGASWWHGR